MPLTADQLLTLAGRRLLHRLLKAQALASPESLTVGRIGLAVASYFAGTPRYVRPNGTSTGSGGGLSNTDAGAWSVAEFITQQGTLAAGTRVIFTGDFTSTSVTLTANDVLLDCRAAAATQGQLLTGWVSAPNGEWKVSGALVGNNAFTQVTEDKIRMAGWTASCTQGAARLELQSVDTVNNRVNLKTGYPLVNNDKIALVTGTLSGLAVNTLYYVADAQTWSGGFQDVGFTTTPSGSKITLPTAGTGNRFFFSDFSGRNSIPVAGALAPGQWAYAPWEDAIYVKPSTGTVDQHTYHIHQLATNGGAVVISGARSLVLGGSFYCNARSGVQVTGANSGFIASDVWSGEHGAVAANVDGFIAYACDIGYHALHGAGSITLADAEPNQWVVGCWIHDYGGLICDYGDHQGLVTNPNSDAFWWQWNLIENGARPLDPTLIPSTSLYNTGAIVVDSSVDGRAKFNYVYNCYGEQIEISPNDVKACTGNQLDFNILNMEPLQFNPAEGPRGVNCILTGASNNGFDATNTTNNNLFVVGKAFGQVSGSNQDSAIFSIRIASAQTGDRTLTCKNNIIMGTPGGTDPAIYALRRTSNAYTVGTFASDGNWWGPGWANVAVNNDDGTNWPTPSILTRYANLAAWRTAKSSDAASKELVAFKDYLSDSMRALLGTTAVNGGVDVGLQRDLMGNQVRKNIGPMGAAEVRATV